MKSFLIFFCILLITGCAWNPGHGRGYNKNVPGSYYFKSTTRYRNPTIYNWKYDHRHNQKWKHDHRYNRKWKYDRDHRYNRKWKHDRDHRYNRKCNGRYCW